MPPQVETLRDWLREHPPAASAFEQSLAGVGGRVLAGEDFRVAVRELVDEFTSRPGGDRASGSGRGS